LCHIQTSLYIHPDQIQSIQPQSQPTSKPTPLSSLDTKWKHVADYCKCVAGTKIQNSQLSGRPSVTTAVMKRTNESLAKKYRKNVQLSGPSVTTAVMKRTNVSESLHFQSKVTKYKVRWLG
jgi:hypothetical protein